MADLLVTTNKDVEGTKSADTIAIVSGSAEVDAGKGNDIVIDASAGKNEVELGQGDDMMKVYVDANLLSKNEYDGGKGLDTLMLMLNKSMYDVFSATNIIYDFEHNRGEFDFSHYQSILGVNLRWEVENFEHLVLNRIASATADSAVTDEKSNVIINVLNNDDDALAELKQIVSVDTTNTKGIVTINADGTVSYDPNGQFNALNNGEKAFDTFTYTLKVVDPNSPSIVSYSTATVSVEVDGITDNHAPVATNASFVMDDSLPTDTEKVFKLEGSIADKVSDDDGNPLAISLVSGPASGILDLHSDGTFTYTSDGNHNGLVTFTYKANDGLADSNVATATINVPFYGTSADDSIIISVRTNIAYGLDGNDVILGNSNHNILYGGNGDDILNGGAGPGDSILIGGSGINTLIGRIGVDTFEFSPLVDNGAVSTVTNFSNVDLIEIVVPSSATSFNGTITEIDGGLQLQISENNSPLETIILNGTFDIAAAEAYINGVFHNASLIAEANANVGVVLGGLR